MGWTEWTYLIALLTAGTVGLSLAIYAWRRRSAPGALPLTWFLIGAQLRVWAPGLRVVGDDIWTAPWLDMLPVIGGAIVPTPWFVMALEYSRGEKGLSRRLLALPYF